MKTKIYKTSTVLIIVIANLLISSSIFAQVKTSTKKVRVDQTIKKKISNTSTKKTTIDKTTLVKKALLINGSDTPIPTPIPTPPYSVGDFIHGGIVFYVDETGEHGLVCAKTDQSTNAPWSMGVYIGIGANEEGLYKGMENTIAAVETESSPTTAPNVCYNLEITEGGITYSDWYLPSKDELSLINQNYAVINTTATANGGDVFYSWYWSSTEDGNYAWLQYFLEDNSSKLKLHKETQICVRAVRRF
jgi:hypothetical protein